MANTTYRTKATCPKCKSDYAFWMEEHGTVGTFKIRVTWIMCNSEKANHEVHLFVNGKEVLDQAVTPLS